jgi:hypothetical protein
MGTDSADKVCRGVFSLYHASLHGLESKAFGIATQVKSGYLGNLNGLNIPYRQTNLSLCAEIVLALACARRYPENRDAKVGRRVRLSDLARSDPMP